MVNWRFRPIFPLCANEIKKIFAIWCAVAEPFRCEVYRCFHTKSQQRDKQNPIHEILATMFWCFGRDSPCRRLRTHSTKFTSVGLDTKRLAPFARSVLVITVKQTSFAALVCLRGLFRVGSRVVIPHLLLLLPLFACSPSRVGKFSKQSIFTQDFWPISDRFLIRNFRNSIRTPLVFDKASP